MAVIYLKTATQTVSPIKYISLTLKEFYIFQNCFAMICYLLLNLTVRSRMAYSCRRSKARSTVQRSTISVSVPSFVNVNWHEPAATTLQHTSLCSLEYCTVLVRFVKGARTT